MRLTGPDLHREVISSRPLFLSAIAMRMRHARQTPIRRVTSSYAKAKPVARALKAVTVLLGGMTESAEQLARLKHGSLSSLGPSKLSSTAA